MTPTGAPETPEEPVDTARDGLVARKASEPTPPPIPPTPAKSPKRLSIAQQLTLTEYPLMACVAILLFTGWDIIFSGVLAMCCICIVFGE